MRKIMKVAAIAALIAAPIEVRAQTIGTAVANAFIIGEKGGGPVVGLGAAIVTGLVVGGEVIVERVVERVFGGPATAAAANTAPGNPAAHPATVAAAKPAAARSGTKTASLAVIEGRSEGPSIVRPHSSHRHSRHPHHA